MGSTCDNVDTGIKVSVLPVEQIDALLSVAVSGIEATISITVPAGGKYFYDLWLSDSATDPEETAFAPTDPVQTEWKDITDANGQATIKFKNSGDSRTWYLWGWFQKLGTSAAIVVGT